MWISGTLHPHRLRPSLGFVPEGARQRLDGRGSIPACKNQRAFSIEHRQQMSELRRSERPLLRKR